MIVSHNAPLWKKQSYGVDPMARRQMLDSEYNRMILRVQGYLDLCKIPFQQIQQSGGEMFYVSLIHAPKLEAFFHGYLVCLGFNEKNERIG